MVARAASTSTGGKPGAIETAERILAEADARATAGRRDPAARSGRWIARDALRELRSEKVLRRF